MIQIVEGKSKAARRLLPMPPTVYRLLKAHHEAQGSPTEGTIFPSESKTGRLTSDGLARQQHERALANSKAAAFPPYTLRHTALTRLGEASGGDVFALARIAAALQYHDYAEACSSPSGDDQPGILQGSATPNEGREQSRKKASQKSLGSNLGPLENRKKSTTRFRELAECDIGA